MDAETPARRQGRKGGTTRAAPPPLPPAPVGTRHPASVFAALQRKMEDASPRWLASQFKMQRKLLPGGEVEEMRTNNVASFFADMLRQPFPRVWAHAAPGSPQVQWYHSLFKFSNPEEEDSAGAMREHGVVFGFVGERDVAGGAPQLFKPAPPLCHSWKKVKVSTEKAEFAAFYGDKSNKNKLWRPELDALTTVWLPSALHLPGELAQAVIDGCAFFDLYKMAGELAQTEGNGV